MSESASVGLLLALTVLVTASVGVGVVFIEPDDAAGVNLNFSFDYRGENSLLLVTPSKGDHVPAGRIVIESDSREVTWDEVAGVPANATVKPGGLPIQLSETSAWGTSVSTIERIELYYAPSEHNRTLLDSWSG